MLLRAAACRYTLLHSCDLFQIEDKISIDTLDALKRKFESADVDGTGALELDEFKKLLRYQLHLPAGKVSRLRNSYGLESTTTTDIRVEINW